MGLVRLLLMLFLWKGVLCDDKYYRLYLPETVTVTAQEGLCVVIPCRFTIQETTGEAAESPRGYWFIKGDDWEGPAVATNDRTRGIREEVRGRFKLAGDVTRRDCSLKIDDVSTRDTGTYYFRYEHSRSTRIKYNYFTYLLHVTVVDLQYKPEISLRDRVMEGEAVTVRCTAPGSCSGTRPEITWSFESEFKYREGVYNTYNPGGTRTYTSTITFIAAMEHNNKRLYCTSYFPAVRKYTTSSVSLTVDCREDTPAISLPDRVIEGETVTVRCTVRGRCSVTAPKISWSSESQVKLYNEQVYGADNTDGTRTYISTITFIATMEHNNKRLSCNAYFPAVDKYTISSGSLTVDYPPETPQISDEDVTTPDNASQKLPLLLPIGGAVIGVVVLAGVCLLAWLISHKVRRTRDNNEGASNEKETVADSIPVYSVVKKTPKVPRAGNNPCSGASTMDSKEDMFVNFSKDNLQYATIHFSRPNPGSKPSPLPEEALYSEVKVH